MHVLIVYIFQIIYVHTNLLVSFNVMPERLPCKSINCERTILPTTAQDTGGFCMPCVQRKRDEQDKAYVSANKKDINQYKNVNNPLEIIKIYHQPTKRDPLIHYVPYPDPIDQVYLRLDSTQIAGAITYVLQLLEKKDAKDTAIDIAIKLVSFINADISSILEALVKEEEYYPSFLFRSASIGIRNKLFEKLLNNTGRIDHIISALAWIGDKEVVAFFSQQQNPLYRNIFESEPKFLEYTKTAGWELDSNGNKQNLYYKKCYPFVKQQNNLPNSRHTTFTAQKSSCKFCGAELTSLFTLDLADDNLKFIECDKSHLSIGTCLRCCWHADPFFAEVGENGLVDCSDFNKNPDPLPKLDDVFERPIENCLMLSDKPRSAYYCVDWCSPVVQSQVGGFPTWIQNDYYPSCPKCSNTMIFIGQIANDDCLDYSEGIYYAFICSGCSMSATTYQQT